MNDKTPARSASGRKLDFYHLTILFALVSFLGWCGETLYFAVRWNDLTDRGFLSLPLCTIYGCCILGELHYRSVS